MVALRFRGLVLLAAVVAFGVSVVMPFVGDDAAMPGGPAGWLTQFTFRAQWALTHEPWSFHLASLLLHLSAVWMAMVLLDRMVPAAAARIGAFLFAVHPLQTEAVVHVSARAALLAALLALAAWRLWDGGRRWPAAVVFGAALLASPTAAGLPAVLGMWRWGTWRERRTARPLALMGAMSVAAMAWVGLAPFEAFAYQGVALLRFLLLLMVPLGLAPEADVQVAPLVASVAWGVIVVVALLSLRGVKAAREGFWLLSGLVLLLPGTLVLAGAEAVSDRRMYLPMICFAALAGRLLAGAHPKLLAGLAVALVVLSAAQARIWRSDAALWTEASRLAPAQIGPKLRLARVLAPVQAVALLEEAQRLAPGNAEVSRQLGEMCLRAGQPARARRELERAIEEDPCLWGAYAALRGLGVQRPKPPQCRWTAEQEAALTSAK